MAKLNVTSLGDLKQKADKNPKYAELAMLASSNLGGPGNNLAEAIRWLEVNATETSEEGVVDEINGVADLL